MPKQIKKEVIPASEKVNRVFAVISMAAALILAGLLIFLLPQLLNDESPVKACIISGGYFVFMLSCILHCITGFVSYGKTQDFTGLFHGLISLVCTFLCLLNLRFVLVLLFSGLNMDSAANKLVGDHTMTEFVNAQTSDWTGLIFAMAAMLIIGIVGIVRLSKK
ncbi:MAG: hypothetical protein ACI4JA_11710 [Oscillospiraceae bacterium]